MSRSRSKTAFRRTQGVLPTSVKPAGTPEIMGLAGLANLQLAGTDILPAYRRLADLAEERDDIAALMDAAILDQVLGWPKRALRTQAAALRAHRLFRVRSRTDSPALRVLAFAIAGPIAANAPVELLVADSDIELYLLYVIPGTPMPQVPEHDVAVVIASAAMAEAPILAELEQLTAGWPRPLVNRPARLSLLGRENLHRLAAPLCGVVAPATVRVDAATLAAIGSECLAIESVLPEGGFPILARSAAPAGGRLEKLHAPRDVANYLRRTAVNEYNLTRFVEYRSPDGRYRMYRVVVIDGVPFPGFLRYSQGWNTQTLTPPMVGGSERPSEDKQFAEGFESGFATRYGGRLAELARISGLDYFHVDCGELPDGRLLLFSAGTSQIMSSLETVVQVRGSETRIDAMRHAFRAMLYRKAQEGPGWMRTVAAR